MSVLPQQVSDRARSALMADNNNDITASQNRGDEVLAVTVAMFVAATVAVILRFISRFGVVKKVSQDDYAMMVAWVSRYRCFGRVDPVLKRNHQIISFGFSFSICYGTSVGLGRHGANVAPEDRGALRKSEYAFSVLYASCRYNIEWEPER